MKAKFKIVDENVWMLEGVRLSFPNLWKPGQYLGAVKTGLDASFLFDPKQDKAVIQTAMKEMVKVARTVSKKVKKVGDLLNPKIVKVKKTNDWVIKTTNSVTYPPIYFGSDGKAVADPLAAGADRILYAGCYVRVKISVNPVMQDDGTVKVWTNIVAIQFLEHGEKLGNGPSAEEVADGFGEVETDFDTATNGPTDDDDEFDEDDFDLDDDDDDDDFDDDIAF